MVLYSILMLCLMVYFVCISRNKMGGKHDVGKKTTKAVTLDIQLDVQLHTSPAAEEVDTGLAPATQLAIIPCAPARSRILVKVKQLLYRHGQALNVWTDDQTQMLITCGFITLLPPHVAVICGLFPTLSLN